MKCNYCQNDHHMIVNESLAPFIPNMSVDVYVVNGYLNISGTLMSDRYNGKTKGVSAQVNYCPMCGRRFTND